MRVGIVGSRNAELLTLSDVMVAIPKGCTQIVSGGAKGVDTLAKKAAQKLDIEFVEFLPDYSKHGKMAPLERNKLIAQNIDLLIAFWDDKSRGTMHTVKECLQLDIPVQLKSIPKPVENKIDDYLLSLTTLDV